MQESNIFFLILFAATLHAGWNLIIKSLKNSLTAIGVKLLLQSIVFIPFIFFVFNSGKKKREGLNFNKKIILEPFVNH